MTGTATILRGNALTLPLADASVDLIVTSPPYFGLRSYQDGGVHYAGQIGSEATPAEFVDTLLAATAEMVRVLKPSGSLWVNLGDAYSSGGRGTRAPDSNARRRGFREESRLQDGFRPKSLMGIPWRYAIACIDQLGLILRAEVIWAKPNGLPESVTDRVRRSHETWFHFVRQPRYFSAVDEIREEHVATATGRDTSGWRTGPSGQNRGTDVGRRHNDGGRVADFATSPLGKLPGSVWSIPTQPLTVPPELGVDHFAAFPMEWPRRIIQGWSPRAVCSECGFLLGSSYDSGMLGVRRTDHRGSHQNGARAQAGPGQEPVLWEDLRESLECEEQDHHELPAPDDSGLCGGLATAAPNGAEVGLHDGAQADHGRALGQVAGIARGGASQERGQDGQPDRELGTAGQDRARPLAKTSTQAVRVPTLRRNAAELRLPQSCPHCGGSAFQPPVVADFFGGTGTVALVAKALGRHGISLDMSSDYCRLATWRTTDEGEWARALQVEKPAKQVDGQLSLLEALA